MLSAKWREDSRSFFEEMAMPRNVHLLIYGDSFMREVGLSLLCENRKHLTAVDDHTLGEDARSTLLALAGNASRGLSRWLALSPSQRASKPH